MGIAEVPLAIVSQLSCEKLKCTEHRQHIPFFFLIKKRFCCNQNNRQRRILSLSANRGVAVRSCAQSECADALATKQTFATGPADYMDPNGTCAGGGCMTEDLSSGTLNR